MLQRRNFVDATRSATSPARSQLQVLVDVAQRGFAVRILENHRRQSHGKRSAWLQRAAMTPSALETTPRRTFSQKPKVAVTD